jgi:DNA-binding protein H-NS
VKEVHLESLTLGELKALAREIESAIRKCQSDNLRKAREAAEAAARAHGYSLDEIMGLKAFRKAAGAPGAKYRNPANAGQGWSGRGRQPQWFKDAIASGKDIEDLRA